MRLIGKGIPRLNGYGKGDHYVTVKVHVSMYLTQRQKEIIQEFAELDNSTSGTVRGVVRGRVRTESKRANDSCNDTTAAQEKRDGGNSESENTNEGKHEKKSWWKF